MELREIETDGVLDVRDAERLGLGADDLGRLVRRGRLIRLCRGHYTTRTDATPEELHLLRTIALVRSYDGRVAASHHSGCLVHGLPLFASGLGRVRLTRTRDRQRRSGADHGVDPRLCAAVTVRRAGLTAGVLALPAAVCVVQTGCRNGAGAALVAADAALRLHRATPDAIAEAVALCAGHRGIRPVRAALEVADGRRESPGESLTALLFARHGVRARPQVVIEAFGVPYRVDFLLEDAPVIVEFDGAAKYATREDVVAEKLREDRLRELGYEVVRITWADLADPASVVRRIEAAVRRSRRH